MASSNKVEPTRSEQLSIMYKDICVFLYDKEKGEVMGRDGASWGRCSCHLWMKKKIQCGFILKILRYLSFTLMAVD